MLIEMKNLNLSFLALIFFISAILSGCDLSISNDIEDWNVYSNEMYGFQIKYPPQFKVAEYNFTTDYIGDDGKHQIEINQEVVFRGNSTYFIIHILKDHPLINKDLANSGRSTPLYIENISVENIQIQKAVHTYFEQEGTFATYHFLYDGQWYSIY